MQPCTPFFLQLMLHKPYPPSKVLSSCKLAQALQSAKPGCATTRPQTARPAQVAVRLAFVSKRLQALVGARQQGLQQAWGRGGLAASRVSIRPRCRKSSCTLCVLKAHCAMRMFWVRTPCCMQP